MTAIEWIGHVLVRLKRLIPPYSTDVGLIFRSAKAVREWSNDASDAILPHFRFLSPFSLKNVVNASASSCDAISARLANGNLQPRGDTVILVETLSLLRLCLLLRLLLLFLFLFRKALAAENMSVFHAFKINFYFFPSRTPLRQSAQNRLIQSRLVKCFKLTTIYTFLL